MKEVISAIVGACVTIFVVLYIMNEIPDSFGYDGFFFDKYPRWMDVVFAFGVVFISLGAGFVSSCIANAVLNSRGVKLWIANRLQRYLDCNVHKFN